MRNSNIIKFKNEFASAELVLLEDGKARVRSVYSTKRKKGHASDVMDQIIEYANEHNLELHLVVQCYGRPANRLDNDQLEAFYSKFGFKRIKHPGQFLMMRRRCSQELQAL